MCSSDLIVITFRGALLANFSLPPSAPQERISSPPTAGISSCPPGRISSAKRISFSDFPNITQLASIGRHVPWISSIFCENRENFATRLRENFHQWWREFPLRGENFACRRDFTILRSSAAHEFPLLRNSYLVIRTSGCYAANSPVRSAGADFVGTTCRFRPALWAGFRPRSGFRFSTVRFKYSYKREMGRISRMMIVSAQQSCARIWV